jgi:hypothetical protein
MMEFGCKIWLPPKGNTGYRGGGYVVDSSNIPTYASVVRGISTKTIHVLAHNNMF